MTDRWDWVTPEMFDDELRRQASNEDLLTIPGVYELVREQLNNEVLEALAQNKHRCVQCGSKLDDEYDCAWCDGEE
jgi:hypothetical protein